MAAVDDENDSDLEHNESHSGYSGSEWLLVDDEDEGKGKKDILKIISAAMKEAKKLKSAHTVKIATQLTTVAEYVKLRTRYRANPQCTKPCTNASNAITFQMGKGPSFARQICENECYLLCHHHLPPPKKYLKGGQWTLLDNQDVFKNVHIYLTAQKLGTNFPHQLCKHVNKIILPPLELTEKKASISECTAINWLKKLGYKCKDVQKGIHIDGHERHDVVEYQVKFLAQMGKYQQ